MMRMDKNSRDKQVPNDRSVLRIGMYRLGKTLGVGSFGKVKVAEHEVTGHKVAIKILNRSKIKALPRMDEKIQREIQMLKLLRHSHIIKLYEVIETASDIFMIMEYVSGGELFDYIVSHGKLSEDDARRFFQQIISGVDYCHRHRIVHRDLKPENLLLDDSHQNVKIADFGLSNFMQDGDFLTTSCGSPNYAAPEVISGQMYAGPEVDVWSCGVILYALVCARLPFDDEHIPNLFKKIRLGAYTIPSHVSPGCRSLIMSMLNVDALARASIEDIKAHPWYQVNLPEYLKYIPAAIVLEQEEDIEEDVLQELLAKFGMTREAAIPLLLDVEDDSETLASPRQSNDIKVAYHLIHDARRMYESKAFAPGDSAYEADLYDMMSRPTPQGVMGLFSPPPSPSPFALPMFAAGLMSPPPSSSSSSSSASGAPAFVNGERAKLLESSRRETKKWYLGIVSSKPPREIMRQVLLALKATGFEWKQSGGSFYQVRCRKIGHFDDELDVLARSSSTSSSSSSSSTAVERERERGIYSSSSGEDLPRVAAGFMSPPVTSPPGSSAALTDSGNYNLPSATAGSRSVERRRERSSSSRERSVSPPSSLTSSGGRRAGSPGRGDIIDTSSGGGSSGNNGGTQRRASGESERSSIVAAMMAMMGSSSSSSSSSSSRAPTRRSDASSETDDGARRRVLEDEGTAPPPPPPPSSSTSTTPARRGRSITTSAATPSSTSTPGNLTGERRGSLCPPVPLGGIGEGGSKRVKLSIQLFKLTSGRYLLDFKKLGGDTFGFFNCCSDLLVLLTRSLAIEDSSGVKNSSTK